MAAPAVLVGAAAALFLVKRGERRRNAKMGKNDEETALVRYGSSRATNNPPWIEPIVGWLKHGPPQTIYKKTQIDINVVPFGEETRHEHFSDLDPCFPAFLNHGSYGASLTIASRAAEKWCRRLERQPVKFMESEVLPELCDTLRKIANLLGEDDPVDSLALVPNATYAVNSVARSVISSSGYVKCGDAVLCLDKSYGACVSALDLACRDIGATLVRVKINEASTDADIVHEFEEAIDSVQVNGGCKFALIDLITSVPPRRIPVEQLCAICRRRGIITLIDAAHGVGCSLPQSIYDLGGDFVCTNLHKWYCTPKGTALLWKRKSVDMRIVPAHVSHGYGRGFSCEFIWQATKNYGPYLAVRESMIWHEAYGGTKRVQQRNHDLVEAGARRLASIIPGSRFVQNSNKMCLAIVELPERVPLDYVPPPAELKPSSMEKCCAALQMLRSQDIKVVVWDMDHTMSSMHCGDGLELSKLDEYVDAVSPDFVSLARALADKHPDFNQAVATGSDPAEYELPGHSRCSHILGPDLARTIIQRKFGHCVDQALKSFGIMVGFDHRLHDNNFPGKESINRKGKRHHMRRIANHYGCTFEQMLLLDDSASSLVNEDGWTGIKVRDSSVGFQFSDLLGDDWNPLSGIGNPPSASIFDTDSGIIDPLKLHFALRERGIEAVIFRHPTTGRLCTRLSASSYNSEREYEFYAFHLLDFLQHHQQLAESSCL